MPDSKTDRAYKEFEKRMAAVVRQIDHMAITVHGLHSGRHNICINQAAVLFEEVKRLREYGGDQ